MGEKDKTTTKPFWERVTKAADYVQVFRMPVIRGWIVMTENGSKVSTVFVPDQQHEWEIK